VSANHDAMRDIGIDARRVAGAGRLNAEALIRAMEALED